MNTCGNNKFEGERYNFKRGETCEIIDVSPDHHFFAPKDCPTAWAPFVATTGGSAAKIAWNKRYYTADMVYKCIDPNGVAYRSSKLFQDRFEPDGIYAEHYAMFSPLKIEGAWMLVHEPVAGCGPKWLPLIKDGRVLFEKGRQPEPGMFVREAAYLSERARALENSGDEEKGASGDVDINAGQGQECKRRDIDGFKCFVNVVDMVCSGYFNGPVRRLDSEEQRKSMQKL